MNRYLSRLRDFGKNTSSHELTKLPKVEQLQNATVLPLQNATKTVLSVLSVHQQVHFSPSDPGPVATRWRVSPPGGAPFELSTLPLEDEAVIRAVLEAWNATPEELAEALAEAEGNPALLANWRREAEGLGLSAVLSVHPRAYFSGTLMPDDRITCRECRLLRPGGRCGSPTWGPRYQPPPRPHRCAEFLPRAGDPDQRSGRARWPGLGLGVAA